MSKFIFAVLAVSVSILSIACGGADSGSGGAPGGTAGSGGGNGGTGGAGGGTSVDGGIDGGLTGTNAQLAAVRAALQGYGVAAALSSQAAYDGYGRIWRVPTTFVIDRDGRWRTDLDPGAAALAAAWLERHVAPLLGS